MLKIIVIVFHIYKYNTILFFSVAIVIVYTLVVHFIGYYFYICPK
jgi:hypothetical protein